MVRVGRFPGMPVNVSRSCALGCMQADCDFGFCGGHCWGLFESIMGCCGESCPREMNKGKVFNGHP